PLKYYFSTHFVSQIFTVCEQTGLSQQPHYEALVGHAAPLLQKIQTGSKRRIKPDEKSDDLTYISSSSSGSVDGYGESTQSQSCSQFCEADGTALQRLPLHSSGTKSGGAQIQVVGIRRQGR